MHKPSFARVVKCGLALLPLALVAQPASAATYITSVVASGLYSPRDLAFGPDGALYVAETGFSVVAPPGEAFTFPNNGSITRICGGVQTRIVNGLPSIYVAERNEVAGPQGIVFDSAGVGYVTIGLGADPGIRPAGSLLGHVLTFDNAGNFASFADVAAYEALNNPLGGPIDSNPFYITEGPGGMFVTDAGANTLYSLSPGGDVELMAGFPGRFIGLPAPSSDSVPTGVAIAPDGTIYVAELTGFPFTPGAARIYSLAPGSSTPVVFSEGFTNLVDLAFGPDGSLYALSHDLDSLIGPDVGGGIYRLSPSGISQSVITGLTNPIGMTIGQDGSFYLTTFEQGVDGSGQVLKVSAVPEPTTWAMLLLGLGAVGAMLRRSRRGGRLPGPRPA